LQVFDMQGFSGVWWRFRDNIINIPLNAKKALWINCLDFLF